MEKEPTENLQVRIKEQISMGDTVVSVNYRPPDQKEQFVAAFYRQLEVASCSQAQAKASMGDQLEGQHSST